MRASQSQQKDFENARKAFNRLYPNSKIGFDEAILAFSKTEYANKEFPLEPIYSRKQWEHLCQMTEQFNQTGEFKLPELPNED